LNNPEGNITGISWFSGDLAGKWLALLHDIVPRGAKPSDLPVERLTKFEFVINLTTAKTLGLTIHASFLSLADELIE
jgi:putative ABC transport system substrate-binding protein